MFDFLASLSPSLRKLVQNTQLTTILTSTFSDLDGFFKDLENREAGISKRQDFMSRLTQGATLMFCQPEQKVIQQGDLVDPLNATPQENQFNKVYIIQSG